MASSGLECKVDEYAKELLKSMEYRKEGRIISIRHILKFFTCGTFSTAQTDVCIFRTSTGLLLLLQEDKRLISTKDPEAQVIAEAIAAFQENNKIRIANYKEQLDKMLIPCITMVGTFPRFYLVPITKELNRNIMHGTFPENETIVLCHIPRVPRRVSDGMKPIENRKKILQCFEVFKKFVDELERELL